MPLKPVRKHQHIHFVGIGGAGMGGIAEVMLNLGYTVSGSDINRNAMVRRLQSLGVKVGIGHAPLHVQRCDLVVISSAIAADNPEVVAARERHIPVISRGEMLAELMQLRESIAVAGTHGKTTTTSLIASLLAEGGLDPTFVIGGRLNSAGSHARLGTGQYLVAEADESDASFLLLRPRWGVVTNIDRDHMETYGGDFGRLLDGFQTFLSHLPFYGMGVLCLDDPGVKRLLPRVNRPFLTYGFSPAADVRAEGLRCQGMRTDFTVLRRGKPPLPVRLNMPGRHHVLNALAAIAVAGELGVDDHAMARALESFQGVTRRLQVHGTFPTDTGEVWIIDDYAHHPREIAATLEAIREAWPDRRLVAAFQPHRYTRTRALFEDFVEVLSGIDVLFLTEVYGAGEAPIPGAGGKDLYRALEGEVHFLPSWKAIPPRLPAVLKGGDVFLILGAGDIGRLAPWLVSRGMVSHG